MHIVLQTYVCCWGIIRVGDHDLQRSYYSVTTHGAHMRFVRLLQVPVRTVEFMRSRAQAVIFL